MKRTCSASSQGHSQRSKRPDRNGQGNPRTIKKDQFEKLKKSIQDNADYFEARPIILSDRTGGFEKLAEWGLF